jgi:ADP-ribosylglycohydrolase
VTDDGELTICQLRGLGVAPEDPIRGIAAAYQEWIRSSPFDVGMATSNGLHGNAHLNLDSKANGSLMRTSPLGVWGTRRCESEIVALARADSSITHPNPACTDAVVCYALAIAHLIANPADRAGAFARAERWVSKDGDAEVAGWLGDAKAGRRPAFHPMAGFVRIGFTEAFRHLLLGSGWSTAVRQTLLRGGDTDTNACIVGGLIGAADGLTAIGQLPFKAVNGANTALGRKRPDWLHPRIAELGVRTLMA